MLKVNGLAKAFGGQVLFEDVSFSLSPGEKVGLVGRNGHGKTTLFKIILGELEADSGKVSAPRHFKIGHLSQRLQFSHDTVLKEACSGLRKNEDWIDETYRAEAVLMGLGIDEELFDASPLSLSGGYQVRLNLAKALVADPDVLLLDEPTNYLDILSIRWLVRFLKDWNGALMLITHDRDFMDSVTTHTMGIHRGRVRKVAGPTEKLYSQILMEEEVYELSRQNDERKRKDVEKFIARFRASATKASAVQSRVKALERKERLQKLEEIKDLDFKFNEAPFQGKYLLEAMDLSFGYGGDGPLLIDDLSFTVAKGDRIGIIGKNGKGKTTLLNMLACELKPLNGTVAAHQNARMAYFGQTNIDRLNRSNTIEKELMEAHPDYSRGVARKICGAMMFEGDAALKKIDVLSGGERARVLLGKLLVSPANLLLLDEPTNHLDMESIDSLIEAVDIFGGAAIIVTHSELMLNALATRLIVFDGGRVSLFDGTYREFLDKAGWESESAVGVKAGGRKEKGVNKKEVRKLRAEVISAKGRSLGPMEKRMAEIEGLIVTLEKAAEEASRALLAASERADAEDITAQSKAYHELRDRIDRLFDELESITVEHEYKSREFEEKMRELEQV
ncbi:MAG TPA: ABC transporter ATP-binding protein [Deltaproteobacteria bacterium]|nr:MAG: ABC transporter ATP-binding protein [Deltaproteobacteria bacterium GWA2_55_82]OGQ65144.1 MAG: ABC transporter ATP-binding protein [Deltaproteobacteria bacterium RIFCSPLOWO2_02_FULL_55_12]OIJ74730.1 MAG: ABC transporter ATP-binding protein [Deltaproteobacteria bacterium GWC2_55_46]HBG45653.1 ABC transporter ATP-binding protein [Deltaproteobacteria bacterium]HCY12154.1 ABC transporter ATP-binding protein [Deltaproteobacteria bacterium]